MPGVQRASAAPLGLLCLRHAPARCTPACWCFTALLSSYFGPHVAYFWPHVEHSLILEKAFPSLRLLRFDFFAPGYQYPRSTVHADVQHIPLQDGAMDGVIILHVLEHVEDLKRAIRELHRVLRSGGFVEHDTPCFLSAKNEPTYSPSAEVVDCSTTKRKDLICSQTDHLFAYKCSFLRA